MPTPTPDHSVNVATRRNRNGFVGEAVIGKSLPTVLTPPFEVAVAAAEPPFKVATGFVSGCLANTPEQARPTAILKGVVGAAAATPFGCRDCPR